jgi:hypothetical protein
MALPPTLDEIFSEALDAVVKDMNARGYTGYPPYEGLKNINAKLRVGIGLIAKVCKLQLEQYCFQDPNQMAEMILEYITDRMDFDSTYSDCIERKTK